MLINSLYWSILISTIINVSSLLPLSTSFQSSYIRTYRNHPKQLNLHAKRKRSNPYILDLENLLENDNRTSLYSINSSMNVPIGQNESSTVLFPEMEQAGMIPYNYLNIHIYISLSSLCCIFRD